MRLRTLARTALGALVAGLVLAGCASIRPEPAAPPRPPVDGALIGSEERGIASWYGPQHQGKRTASGERFDMARLTAAHPRLPLGTRVEVTNLRNGRTVEVTINDRGPTVDGRIIDLSWAAARAIDLVERGVVPVRVRVLSVP